MFFWNSLAFSMIQRMLAIWSLVPLPFQKPAWTSGSSQFTYCWSLAWRILSITLLAVRWVRCKARLLMWTLPCFLSVYCHKLPLSTAFTVSHKFSYVGFFKSLFSSTYCLFLLWFIYSLRMWCLNSTYLWIFQFSFCYWFPVSSHCGQKRYLVWFQSS